MTQSGSQTDFNEASISGQNIKQKSKRKRRSDVFSGLHSTEPGSDWWIEPGGRGFDICVWANTQKTPN